PSRVDERRTPRFAELTPGVAGRYRPTGSGEGVRQIKARAVHIGGTDSPLSPQQLSESKLVQIPMVVGGLVPVINLPGVGANQLVLNGEVLADIMRGDITRWDDARVAALNAGVNLPGLPIKRIVREDASGSTEVWTRYLAQSSAKFASALSVSQKPAWPGSTLGAKGNDGVAALLKDTPGGIGYVSFDRVLKDRLAGVKLRNPAGNVVAASEDAFRAAILASDVYRKGDDTASLLGLARADAWPLTATSYLLLDAEPKDMVSAEWVARFVYWCFMHGDELTRGTGFAPLPERVQAKLSGRLLQIHGPGGQVPKFIAP
ncbi:MAG: phosphate ABC transporter substrate-binding protein PstS, partial [Aquabacterium sp.]|nr:phosphate ABC transporter substrate-binding protein PstS [Aquabacterium sp.]